MTEDVPGEGGEGGGVAGVLVREAGDHEVRERLDLLHPWSQVHHPI